MVLLLRQHQRRSAAAGVDDDVEPVIHQTSMTVPTVYRETVQRRPETSTRRRRGVEDREHLAGASR
jgi:hypothetical protein